MNTWTTRPALLLHRLLQAHPLLVFDAVALSAFMSVKPEDTWTLACEALTDDADQLPKLLDLSDLSAASADSVLSELDQAAPQDAQLLPFLLGDIVPGADLGRWALTQVTKAPDGGKHWLRWHDARVWVHLLWIATPAQLSHLVGPARSVGWAWPGRAGQTVQWHQSSLSLEAGVPPPESRGWSVAQWQQIQSIGVINRLFARRGAPDLADIPGQARQMAEADAQAHSMTIWDMASRVEFVEHTLTYGVDFWQDEQFHQLMTLVATKEATYAEVAGAQSAKFWERLGH